MNGPEDNFSRLNRKKGRNRTNSIMNILIAIVVVLIIITASMIFLGGNSKNKTDEKAPPETEETKDDAKEDDGSDSSAIDGENEDENESLSNDNNDATDDTEVGEEKSGVVTYESPDDEVIDKTIINTGWKPIGTEQTGDHVSLYDGTSVDWNEKIDAISYATGLSKDAMTIWKLKNGGNPQKSVGIVSSKDKADKYRVYLDWVDGEGWQPVKMDILATLDFDY